MKNWFATFLVVLVATPVSSTSSNFSTTTNFISNATRANAVQFSLDVMLSLDKMRGNSDDYYAKLFNALEIYYCDHLNSNVEHTSMEEGNAVWSNEQPKTNIVPPYIRFVHESHPNALKDDAGSCIKVQNPTDSIKALYASEYCEVQPNCYWHDLRNTTSDRVPTYSNLQAVEPPPGSMQLADAKTFLTEWARGIALCVAPSIVFGIVCLLSSLLFVMCRYCCNRCGGRNPSDDGYSCLQKTIPISVFIFFASGIVALAAISIVYYNIAVSSSDNVFDSILNLINGIVVWIKTAKAPLVHIRDSVEAAADSAASNLASSAFIEDGLHGIVSRLNAFVVQTSNVVLPTGCQIDVDTICLECEVCTAVNTQASAAAMQMELVAAFGIGQLNSTRDAIISTLISTKDTIRSNVDAGINMVESITPTIGPSTESITSVRATWREQTFVRRGGILALFALSLAVIVIGLIGIVLGLSPLRCLVFILHIAYILGFIALIFFFLVSAVLTALSVLMSDVCHLSTILDNDWTPVLGFKGGAALNACFDNSSLLHALHLEDDLSFADVITFPQIDVVSMLQFNALDEFAVGILAANLTTFHIGNDVAKQSLDGLNTFTSTANLSKSFSPETIGSCSVHDGRYSLDDLDTPWLSNGEPTSNFSSTEYIATRYRPLRSNCANIPHDTCAHNRTCDYDSYVLELYTNTSTLLNVSVDATTFVTNMHYSMYGLQNYTSDFKSNITNLVNQLNSFSNTLEGSLLVDVNDFKSKMYCSFVANGYIELYFSLCEEAIPGLFMVSICLFLAGIFMIPLNISIILLVKRLKVKKNRFKLP